MSVTTQRAERVAEAQRLRAEGLKFREIAERMGLPISTVDSYINDPDRAKQQARFARYGGTCPQCGGPRKGHHGLKITDENWCQKCRTSEPHSVERARRNGAGKPRRWSDEQILRAIRHFYERYGNCSVPEWNRHRSTRYPSSALVIGRFDGWNAALDAAGIPTVPGAYDYEQIDPDGCVMALRVASDLLDGAVPSIKTYTALRRRRPDLGLPSDSLIRIRCGTWVAALEAAFPTEEVQ